jgi:hypothetical protein
MRTFLNIHDDNKETAIIPADEGSMRVYEAMKAALDAEADLEQAQKDPSLHYTGQYSPVDFWGHKENAFNRAVDALGAAIKDLVRE